MARYLFQTNVTKCEMFTIFRYLRKKLEFLHTEFFQWEILLFFKQITKVQGRKKFRGNLRVREKRSQLGQITELSKSEFVSIKC